MSRIVQGLHTMRSLMRSPSQDLSELDEGLLVTESNKASAHLLTYCNFRQDLTWKATSGSMP